MQSNQNRLIKRVVEFVKADKFIFPLMENICKLRNIPREAVSSLFCANCESCDSVINHSEIISAALIAAIGTSNLPNCKFCGHSRFIGVVVCTDEEKELLQKDRLFITLSKPTSKLIKVCPPGLNISLEIPDAWFYYPLIHTDKNWSMLPRKYLNPFACPLEAPVLGPKKLLTCALAIETEPGRYQAIIAKGGSSDPKEIIKKSYQFDAELRLQSRKEKSVPGCEFAEIGIFKREVVGYKMILHEMRLLKNDMQRSKGKTTEDFFQYILISCSSIEDEYELNRKEFERILDSVSGNAESSIGLCFDIEKIETLPDYESSRNYALFAFDYFSKRTDIRKLKFSQLYWGDIMPSCKYFCLKIISPYPMACQHIREVFGILPEADGLAPLDYRFLTGVSLDTQPLPLHGKYSDSEFYEI